MADTRYDWLAATISPQLGWPQGKVTEALRSGPGAGAVAAFLDGAATLLVVSHAADSTDAAALTASNSSPIGAGPGTIAFTKSAPGPLPLDNPASAAIATSVSAAPEALFQSLHSVYLPLLSKLPGGASGDRVRDLLSQLDDALGNSMRKAKLSGGSLSSAQSVAEAAAYWGDRRNTPDGAVMHGALEPIAASAAALDKDAVSVPGAADELDKMYEALISVWDVLGEGNKYVLNADGMTKLLHLIGATLTAFVQRALGSIEGGLWRGDASAAPQSLQDAADLLRLWLQHYVRKLMADWGSGGISRHTWDGPTFTDASVTGLLHRLEELQELVGLAAEIRENVAPSQRASIDAAFAGLSSVNALQVSRVASEQWAAARASLESALTPVDAATSARLKERLSGHVIPSLSAAVAALGNRAVGAAASAAQPLQVFQELLKARCLLSRPAVAAKLEAEQASIAGLAQSYFRHLNEEIVKVEEIVEMHGDATEDEKAAIGTQVRALVWAKQCLLKVEAGGRALKGLVPPGADEPPAIAGALKTAAALKGQLAKLEKDKYKVWLDDVSEQMSTVKGWQSAKLLERDVADGGRIKAYFNNQLVTLISEVRQLRCLGFKIPRELEREVKVAEKFYHYGMMLQQVANFYNTISDHLLECHKPCLLEYAKAFEALCLKPADSQGKPITWNSAAALENYMLRIDKARQVLVDKNRLLRAKHSYIGEQMALLSRLDLVKQRSRWLSIVEAIRRVFVKCESEFPRDLQNAWRAFWDQQLLKLLSAQFARDIRQLSESLPSTEISLAFVNRQVQFEPPLEDIRSAYYRDHLGQFLGLPSQVRGFSLATEVKGSAFFKSVLQHNARAIAACYAHAEGVLFTQLKKHATKYTDWTAMGAIDDVNTFVSERVSSVQGFEKQLELLKLIGRDLHKYVPNEVKEAHYVINLGPLKRSVEGHISLVRDALVNVLRAGAQADKDEIQRFIEESQSLLTQEASSLSEIGAARIEAQKIMSRTAEMRERKQAAEDKNRVLRAMARGIDGTAAAVAQTVDLTDLGAVWESLMGQLVQHEATLDRQKGDLAVQASGNVSKFENRIEAMMAKWAELKPGGSPNGSAETLMMQFEEMKAQLGEMKSEAAQIQADARAFDIEVPSFTRLDDLTAEVEATVSAWSSYKEFSDEKDALATASWDEMRNNLHKVDDFISKWAKKAESMEKSSMTLTLLKEVDSYRKVFPHLPLLRGTNWESKHWQQMFQRIGLKGKSKDSVQLKDLLSKSDVITAAVDDLKELNAQAQSEAVIKKALDELDLWGLQRKFALTESQDSAGGKLLLVKEFREVISEVGDQQSLAASLRQSKYFSMFQDQIEGWEKRLQILQDGITSLSNVQRRWVYLEPIFSRGALPEQQARFRQVDDTFKNILGRIAADPLLRSFADMPSIEQNLESMLRELDACQNALFQFLEAKRSLFPRFYFLGDDDLLEILGQASNPEVIQSHLKKLFAGIHGVTLDKGRVTEMLSIEREVVPLAAPAVAVSEVIEAWLASLTNSMRATLRALLKDCLALADEGKKWAAMPSQIISLSQELRFTQDAEEAIGGGALTTLQKKVQNELEKCTSTDFSKHRLASIKVKALILDVIHHRDVVDALLEAKVSNVADWSWQKQLRYYMDPTTGIQVRMVHANMAYAWEYQGNAPKLVYTPLTDKCYLTLTAGMALGFGGNPYGPAGTGKTESVKALGQALGRQVLVFNCDEEFDFKSMGRIFVGLLKCGAWGCFDEFNRLEEDVLSAVSQQIQIIQGALKEGSKEIMFMGSKCSVDSNAGIFVTLNPAGKGYGGRSRLPDNLKQLFRSVAMSVPDNDLIAEVMLLSEGFHSARDLGRKLVSLFSLSKQILSSQQHYDWGLRSLKTVLSVAGKMLRDTKAAGKAFTAAEESESVLRAVRATKLPTLTTNDLRLFKNLVADMWPRTSVSDLHDTELEAALRKVVEERSMQVVQEQIEKAQQLHLSCEQRMGIILMGPSGSGKSTLWGMLADAYKHLGRAPVIYKMNPKAMPRQQLLGRMDLDTREWFDGVLTACARKVVKEPLDQRSWIVCDGDIDPAWVESLNSVLDDNRLLTMPNGERIQFANNVNFIFECHSLDYASPATVSRCGIIYMSDDAVDATRSLKRFVAENGLESNTELSEWMDMYFPRALDWLDSHALALDTSKVGVIDNALSQLRSARDARSFAVGLARGLASNLAGDTRTKFLSALEGWTSQSNLWALSSAEDPVSALRKAAASGPGVGMIAASGSSAPLSADIVMTDELRTALAVVTPWLRSGEPFVVVGPRGAGKSSLLQVALSAMPSVACAEVSCNAQTMAEHIIQKLLQVCGKPVTSGDKKVVRPRGTSKLILLLRDVNLPRPDKYNTVQVAAFLQQCITHCGFYNEHLDFIHLQNIQVVALMEPASTIGRQALTPRLSGIMRVLALDVPPEDSLRRMFTPRAASALKAAQAATDAAAWAGSGGCTRLVSAIIDTLREFRKAFPADEHPHYTVTARDIGAWIDALARYEWAAGGLSIGVAAAHEGARLLRDRLVSAAHRTRLDGMFGQVLLPALKVAKMPDGMLFSTLGAAAGARLKGDAAAEQLSQWSQSDFLELVKDKLKKFEREHRALGMQITPETLALVARFDGALARPGGALLLVGRAGAGRRSALSLVAFAQHLRLLSPPTVVGFGAKHFRAFLKDALRVAGIEGVPAVMHIEDHHLVDASFLETVNSLLASAEVPGLFGADELDKELRSLEETKSAAGCGGMSVYEFFVYRVRKNLRIAVSLNPDNPAYAARVEANPALLTETSIQWLDAWSPQQQDAVSKALCAHVDGSAEAGGEARLPEWLRGLHAAAQNKGLGTPRHFTTLVAQYLHILETKRSELLEQITFLQGGLEKLAGAEATVETLNKDAAAQRQRLQEKQKQVDAAMVSIEKAIDAAHSRKVEVEQLSAKQAKEQGICTQRKHQVESELQHVQPLIEKAKASVGSLKAENLNEVRSLKAPPDKIRQVLIAVLRMMGQSDTSWNNMKKFLAGLGVKDKIMNFDARTLTRETRQQVREHTEEYREAFTPEIIYRVSVAAAPLAEWCVAQLKYSEVLQEIEPLTTELDQLQRSLAEGAQRLTQCEAELAELDARKVELQNDHKQRVEEAAELKLGLKRAEATLASAASLLGKLSGEKQSWSAQSEEYSTALTHLPACAAVAAAFITYLASEAEDVRSMMLVQWRALSGLALPPDFSLRGFLSSESEMLKWKAEGLQGDELSAENAIIVKHTRLTPLLIDPSSRAMAWYRAHERAGTSTLEVTTLYDARFATTLELAVRFGKVLIVEEVDSIAPVLFSILRRDLQSQGLGHAITIGDKTVDYNPAFKLVLATRDASLQLPPDAAPLLAVTNFSVTRSGLEAQLLGITIQHELPELEQQRSELLNKQEAMKVELADLNRALLTTLARSTGNILDNLDLVKSLDGTKAKACEIADALASARTVRDDLDAKRNAYLAVAAQATRIFFVLTDLVALNSMYTFSLASFVELYKRALADSPKSGEVSMRIASVNPIVVRTVFAYVSRALFNADRLTFAVHFTQRVVRDRGGGEPVVPATEWEHFVTSTTSAAAAAATDGSGRAAAASGGAAPRWLPQPLQQSYAALRSSLPDVVASCSLDSNGEWAEWFRSREAETLPACAGNLTRFQRVLVLQALRPDRLKSGLEHLVLKELGLPSIAPAASSMAALREESTAKTPVLFIITPGGDPSQELLTYARQVVGANMYHEVAMGQGQTDSALALLESCASSGAWLCLKNCHLVASWLPLLEKAIHSLTPHASFRLWLTSEPHPRFPSSLLENSLKVAFEAPPGVKRNFQRCIAAAVSGAAAAEAAPMEVQLLTALAWFHAIVQERRSYVPQGWSKFYEFSGSDLAAGSMIVARASAGAGRSPRWTFILGLLENAIYGGRLDNAADVRTLQAYLRLFFSPKVVEGSSALLGTQLTVPSSGNIGEVKALAKALPDADTPAIFGLAANVDRAAQEAASRAVICDLQSLRLRRLASTVFDREQWKAQLRPLLTLWGTLVASNPGTLGATAKRGGVARTASLGRSAAEAGVKKTPVEDFLELEQGHGEKLAWMISGAMSGLGDVLKGSALLTPALDADAKALLAGAVPAAWDAAWEGPPTPAEYMNSVACRAAGIATLKAALASGRMLQGEVPLSSFFHPMTFLNTVRQLCAHLSSTGMDALDLQTVIGEGQAAPRGCAAPVCITGLVLEGAVFSGRTLEAVAPDAPSLSALPPVVFAWVARRTQQEGADMLPVPLYMRGDRSRHLLDLHIPVRSAAVRETLLLSGAAVFMNS